MVELHPLDTIGEVRPGDDLVTLLGQALPHHEDRAGDVLVVTQKVVSKSEDRYIDLTTVVPGTEAVRIAGITGKDPRLVELVLSESVDVVRAAPQILITRHRSGLVMANAGIDRSNLGSVDSNRVLLLPEDADASANALRAGLADRYGCNCAVVISDSFGRPWRHGVVCVAIGASGLPSLVDRRGERDRDGRTLEATQVALADMVATAAGLVTGEGAEGIPAALVRGITLPTGDSPASALVRPLEEDLFR